MKKRIGIIGSTGSIGRQAVDVIERNRDLFDVVFLSTHVNTGMAGEQASRLDPDYLIVTGNTGAVKNDTARVQAGMEPLVELLRNEQLDMVLVAAVGAAGIIPTYEAACRGVDIALANKESIVSAGRLITEKAKETGARIIPVDSEHSAIYQCLMGQDTKHLHSITLTASGGPFRGRPADALRHVTVDEALKHPNWAMGNKITVDSATMMNKGLELIEARYLFDVEPDRLQVTIHPQSIIHSMVSFTDGSMLAQLGNPDMRVPISFALGFPERIESGVQPLDFNRNYDLKFERPDLSKYRCLDIAYRVLREDKNSGMIVMNAANEIAVAAFLAGGISFTGIAEIIESTLEHFEQKHINTIDEVLELDKTARVKAGEILKARV